MGCALGLATIDSKALAELVLAVEGRAEFDQDDDPGDVCVAVLLNAPNLPHPTPAL